MTNTITHLTADDIIRLEKAGRHEQAKTAAALLRWVVSYLSPARAFPPKAGSVGA